MDGQPITHAEMVELLSSLKAEQRTELAELKAELRTELTELKAELKAEMAEMKRELIDTTQEQVRDAQTEILKAFLPYQERTNVRFRAFEAKVSNTETELYARNGDPGKAAGSD